MTREEDRGGSGDGPGELEGFAGPWPWPAAEARPRPPAEASNSIANESEESAQELHERVVWLGPWPPRTVCPEDIRDTCGRFGEVEDVEEAKNRSFAFVLMRTREAAERLRAEKRFRVGPGRGMEVNAATPSNPNAYNFRAPPRPEDERARFQARVVWVGSFKGLPGNRDPLRHEVVAACRRMGALEAVQELRGGRGGIMAALVLFRRREDAERAVKNRVVKFDHEESGGTFVVRRDRENVGPEGFKAEAYNYEGLEFEFEAPDTDLRNHDRKELEPQPIAKRRPAPAALELACGSAEPRQPPATAAGAAAAGCPTSAEPAPAPRSGAELEGTSRSSSQAAAPSSSEGEASPEPPLQPRRGEPDGAGPSSSSSSVLAAGGSSDPQRDELLRTVSPLRAPQEPPSASAPLRAPANPEDVFAAALAKAKAALGRPAAGAGAEASTSVAAGGPSGSPFPEPLGTLALRKAVETVEADRGEAAALLGELAEKLQEARAAAARAEEAAGAERRRADELASKLQAASVSASANVVPLEKYNNVKQRYFDLVAEKEQLEARLQALGNGTQLQR
eukprot:tig00020816_g14121.t1